MTTSRKPVCICLIGPPCVGKSTFRKTYVQSLNNPVIISSDDIVESAARAIGVTHDDMFHELDEKFINRVLRNRIQYAIKNNYDIVIDRTNMTKRSRRRFMSVLTKKYTREAFVFHYDLDKLLERLHIRNKSGKNVHVPVDHVMGFIDCYEEPDLEEFSKIHHINTFED